MSEILNAIGTLIVAAIWIAVVLLLVFAYIGPLIAAAVAAFYGNTSGALVLIIIQFVLWWLLS